MTKRGEVRAGSCVIRNEAGGGPRCAEHLERRQPEPGGLVLDMDGRDREALWPAPGMFTNGVGAYSEGSRGTAVLRASPMCRPSPGQPPGGTEPPPPDDRVSTDQPVQPQERRTPSEGRPGAGREQVRDPPVGDHAVEAGLAAPTEHGLAQGATCTEPAGLGQHGCEAEEAGVVRACRPGVAASTSPTRSPTADPTTWPSCSATRTRKSSSSKSSPTRRSVSSYVPVTPAENVGARPWWSGSTRSRRGQCRDVVALRHPDDDVLRRVDGDEGLRGSRAPAADRIRAGHQASSRSGSPVGTITYRAVRSRAIHSVAAAAYRSRITSASDVASPADSTHTLGPQTGTTSGRRAGSRSPGHPASRRLLTSRPGRARRRPAGQPCRGPRSVATAVVASCGAAGAGPRASGPAAGTSSAVKEWISTLTTVKGRLLADRPATEYRRRRDLADSAG